MNASLVINIGCLVNVRTGDTLLRGEEMAALPYINNAWLRIREGKIDSWGKMDQLPSEQGGITTIDAKGAFVLPSYCDSHTHLVFAAAREGEFIDKLKGMSYADIAAKGGGILHSARRLNEMSEDELFERSHERLQELIMMGTGAVEIKSGYGLTLAGELKMLRVIRRLKETAPIPVKATFLGAHAFPAEYAKDHEGYIKLLIDEMLPAIGKEQLADYIDVFCEEGFFTVKETERICAAGATYGLKARLHANQLNAIGAVEAGVKMGAISVDHLETMNSSAIEALGGSKTIGTMLPGAAFFLRMPYPPARELLKANAALALASDYNPGSCPSGNMHLVVSLACIQMKMLPEEAINAATLNGAFALELEKELGSIQEGNRANLMFMKGVDSIAQIPYFFGSNLVERVMVNGEFI